MPVANRPCGNGQAAGGYNRNTGRAWTSQTNQNGVHTTQTNRGEAKTMNGKGGVHRPGSFRRGESLQGKLSAPRRRPTCSGGGRALEIVGRRLCRPCASSG